MPSSPERERFRKAEVFAGAPLRSVEWRCEFARDRAELGTVEQEVRSSARQVEQVCAFAKVQCPASIARLARGEGAAVKDHDLPAQPARQAARKSGVEYATASRQ